MKKVTKKNVSKVIWNATDPRIQGFLYVILGFLILYIWGLSYYIFTSHSEIKGIYDTVERNKIDTKQLERELERIKRSKLDKIYNLDLNTDESITKFVNSKVSFNNKWYIPKELVSIKSDYVFDTKGNQILRKEAKEALDSLSKEFYQKFEKKISVVSAYRSYVYQQWIKNRWCPDNLCAKAWYSEHQSGLAVDLWETTTKAQFMSKPDLANYYVWLFENAHYYGFTNTYQKGLNIDGYEIEPWHWRYVWVDLARFLKESNITFAEFYYEKK